MPYAFNHVHLKAPDPEKTAQWYVKAFNFKIVSDTVRAWGDRFIRCETEDGVVVNISGARHNEHMNPGDASAHWGLEHIGISVDDIQAEVERLTSMGAKLIEGPVIAAPNLKIAFIEGPDSTRIELLESSG